MIVSSPTLGAQGHWLKKGDNIYNATSGGVGINQSIPLSDLHIKGFKSTRTRYERDNRPGVYGLEQTDNFIGFYDYTNSKYRWDVNATVLRLNESVSVSEAGIVTLKSIADSNTSINTTAGDSATINAISGRFRKDTSGTTFTLTNSYITANSIILLTKASNDPDVTLNVVAAAGSAVINFSLAPGSDLDVNFLVIN